jgi:hypothetical protein
MDFKWLECIAAFMRSFSPFSNVAQWTPHQWILLVVADTKVFLKSVKAISQLHCANILDDMHASCGAVNIGIPWPCYVCGATLASRQAHAVHMCKAHGIRHNTRAYVDSSATCFACLLQFSSRTRCVEHIKEKSDKCRSFLYDNMVPMTDEEIRVLDTAELEHTILAKRGGHRRPGLNVCVRSVGPSQLQSETSRHPVGPHRRFLAA